MKCPNCNLEVAENTKFCPECGAKMPEAAEVAPALEVENTTQDTNQTVATPEEKSKKKKKIKKIIIISVSSLLACGLIFLALWLLNPFCMFGHHNVHTEGQVPTCTEHGDQKEICDV